MTPITTRRVGACRSRSDDPVHRRRRYRRLLAIGGLVLVAASFTACGGDSDDATLAGQEIGSGAEAVENDDESAASRGKFGTAEIAGTTRTFDGRRCEVPNPDLEYSVGVTFLADGRLVAQLLINDDPETAQRNQSFSIWVEATQYAARAQDVGGTWMASRGVELDGPLVELEDNRATGFFTVAAPLGDEENVVDVSVNLAMPDPADC